MTQFVMLPDPAVLPYGAYGAAFSPDSQMMSIVGPTGSHLTIYQIVGTTFTKLSDPAILPLWSYEVAFSPDGQFMAIAGFSYLTIYQVVGTTFTKIADPAVLPTLSSRCVAFSPDGKFLAVGYDGFIPPRLIIYEISGVTFTALPDPVDLPTNNVYGVAFSPDSQFLAVSHLDLPYVTIYQIVDTTFTKLADPVWLPAGDSLSVAFSPDGNFLAVGHKTSPYVTVYQVGGIFFEKCANPVDLPAERGMGVAFSPDSAYLCVSHLDSPYVTIYNVVLSPVPGTSTFTITAYPTDLPSGDGHRPAFSPDGKYLVLCHDTTPYIGIYATVVILPTVHADSYENLTYKSVTFVGNLEDDGGGPCNVRFEYDETETYSIYTDWQLSVPEGLFSADITGLRRNTTYHFRAVATNSEGTSYSYDYAFITLRGISGNINLKQVIYSKANRIMRR